MSEHETALQQFADFLDQQSVQSEKVWRTAVQDLRIEVATLKADLCRAQVEITQLKAGPITDVEQMLRRFEARINRSLNRAPMIYLPARDRSVN